MQATKQRTVTVKSGRFKGEEFRLEGTIEEALGADSVLTLPILAMRGNPAAHNAIFVDGYTRQDGPFYYGKIGSFGYIISKKDLGI